MRNLKTSLALLTVLCPAYAFAQEPVVLEEENNEDTSPAHQSLKPRLTPTLRSLRPPQRPRPRRRLPRRLPLKLKLVPP